MRLNILSYTLQLYSTVWFISTHKAHQKNRMLIVTQRWESHAAAVARVRPLLLLLNVFFLWDKFWQRFWTPIDVLPENNSPKSVVIPKVVTFGVFKINFPFLHSVWLTLGDKVCSQRWRKRGCCWAIATSLGLPMAPGKLCQIIVCVCVCVLLCVPVSVCCFVSLYEHKQKPTCMPWWVRFASVCVCNELRGTKLCSILSTFTAHSLDSCTWLWACNNSDVLHACCIESYAAVELELWGYWDRNFTLMWRE